MNMLTNKVPFGLLSEDEQELFKSVNDDFQWYNNGKWMSAAWDYYPYPKNPSYAKSTTYRLKLKEGEFYTYTAGATCTKMIDSVIEDWITWSDQSKSNIECFECFRPATQEEIDSVKPKSVTFVDVEIEWVSKMAEIRHPENKKIYNITAKPIGWTLSGWMLSGYVMEGGYHTNTPIKFQENGTVINERAVSARFVRLEQ